MSDITNRQRVNRATGQPPRPRRRPHIELGDTRSESFGEWLYSHRLGFVAVIISILVGGLWIATARVNIEIPPIEYIIEFVDQEPTPEEVEKLKQQRDKLQQEIDRRLAAVQQVKNVQSNESAEEGGAESQNYDNETQQMMDKVASDMASNRSDYESGMREANGIGKGGSGNGSGGKKGDGKDKNFKGAVTVSYDINYISGNKKVARTARASLYKPAYLAKEGGYVVLEVRVDRNGTVKSAVVKESSNSALNEIARKAALNTGTIFNIDPNAPVSNVGTITYTFVAQ
ncbi:MAG: energy transducer TonB [Alistipes sp.]|nr:energy transducer TonB [Alistipes sp.]MBR0362766.1 energy transducer TonB [Alistipes sp.]